MPSQAASLQVERLPEAVQEQVAFPATRPHTAPPAHAAGTLRRVSPSPPHSPSSSPTRRPHDRSAEWGGRSHRRSSSAPGSPRRPDVLRTSRAQHDQWRLNELGAWTACIRCCCPLYVCPTSHKCSDPVQEKQKARLRSGDRMTGLQLQVSLDTAACTPDTACCRRRYPCLRERPPRAALRCHGPNAEHPSANSWPPIVQAKPLCRAVNQRS